MIKQKERLFSSDSRPCLGAQLKHLDFRNANGLDDFSQSRLGQHRFADLQIVNRCRDTVVSPDNIYSDASGQMALHRSRRASNEALLKFFVIHRGGVPLQVRQLWYVYQIAGPLAEFD